MSYKVAVYERVDSKAAYNCCRFATREEAQRAGSELLSRWLLPERFEVHESDDPVNYEFPADAARPRSIVND